MARHVHQFPGGKGANQAVAAARLGAKTLMIGAVGADEPGTTMRAYLQQAGVDVSGVKILSGHPTGQAYINVSASGENAIVVASGANGALAPEDIVACTPDSHGVFLAQLESPLESIIALFSGAAARRGTTILNAAPANAAGVALFALTDILVVNETELASFAGMPDAPVSKGALIVAARGLICRDGQTVVVTIGADGAVVVDATQSYDVPGCRVQVKDTTGAGDCFCGALAAGLGEGLPVNSALRLAVTAASISVERMGAATSMPTRAEVESRMAD